MVMTVIGASDEADRSMKEVVSLLGVIGTMSQELNPAGQHLANIQTWMLKVTTELDIGEHK